MYHILKAIFWLNDADEDGGNFDDDDADDDDMDVEREKERKNKKKIARTKINRFVCVLVLF